MSSLAKPTLDNKAQMAEAFAKGVTTKSAKVTKIFHAPAGYRRLTILALESLFKQPYDVRCGLSRLCTR